MREASRKDKDNNLLRALRALGYNLTAQDIEVMLNVSELINEKGGDVTLFDLSEKRDLALSLFNP